VRRQRCGGRCRVSCSARRHVHFVNGAGPPYFAPLYLRLFRRDAPSHLGQDLVVNLAAAANLQVAHWVRSASLSNKATAFRLSARVGGRPWALLALIPNTES